MRKHSVTKTSARPASAAVEFFTRKLEFEIGPYTLKEILDTVPAKVYVIDVRDAGAFGAGHLPMATNIPFADLAGRLAMLPKDRMIVTYCGDITCLLSSKAALEFARKGFKVQHLLGGIAEWSRKGYPVESARPAAEPEAEEEVRKQNEEGGPEEDGPVE